MDFEPEHIEIHYAVRYYDKARKKWFVSGYRMTVETAKAHYQDTEWEIVESSRVERRCGGQPQMNPTSRYM